MTTTLALTPLGGHFAARIDAPFDELLDEASHQALRDALVDHKVLVLPGADPSIEQHIALATVFGDAEPPQPQNPRHEDFDLVCVFDSAEGYEADRWHSDETFTDAPSSGAALVMRINPTPVATRCGSTPRSPTTRSPMACAPCRPTGGPDTRSHRALPPSTRSSGITW